MRQTLESLKDEPTQATSILVMGPPLSGKTRSLITYMRWLRTRPTLNTRPVWYFDLSGARESFTNLAIKEGFDKDITVFTYRRQGGDRIDRAAKSNFSADVGLEIINDINSLYDPLDSKGQPKDISTYPSTLIIDDTTNLSEAIMEFAVAMSGTKGGELGASMSHYGHYANKMQEIRKSIKSLPLIFILLSHDNFADDGTIVPYLLGRVLPPVWAKDFSIVLYTRVELRGEKSVFLWQTRPSEKLRSAGTRFREDLPQLVEQDFAKVLA